MELEALNNLIKNHDLIIQKADKGNAVVVLNKEDYIACVKSKFDKVDIEPGKDLNYILTLEDNLRKVFRTYV